MLSLTDVCAVNIKNRPTRTIVLSLYNLSVT